MSTIKASTPTGIFAIFSLIAVAALAAALLTIPMQVSAQSDDRDWKQSPTGLNVTAGDAAGELDITWDAHPQTSKTLSDYRVTWTPDGEDFKTNDQTEWYAYPTTNQVSVTGLDAGETYKVRVRARYDNNKKSRWSDVVSGQTGVTTNTPATGQPTIAGTVEVRETLTAATSAISDDNGLTNAVFSHQWVRSANGSDNDITTPPVPPVIHADTSRFTSPTQIRNPDQQRHQGSCARQFRSPTTTGTLQKALTSNATTSVPVPARRHRTAGRASDRPTNTRPRSMTQTSVARHLGPQRPAGISAIPGDSEFRRKLIFLLTPSTTSTATPPQRARRPRVHRPDLQHLASKHLHPNRAAAGHNDIQAYSDGFTVVGCTADNDARDNTATTYTSSDKGVPSTG